MSSKKKYTSANCVKCVNCQHAVLMRWGNNPIIAQCAYTQDRDVANRKRICARYEEATSQKSIENKR